MTRRVIFTDPEFWTDPAAPDTPEPPTDLNLHAVNVTVLRLGETALHHDDNALADHIAQLCPGCLPDITRELAAAYAHVLEQLYGSRDTAIAAINDYITELDAPQENHP